MILGIKFSSRKTMRGSPWSVGTVKGNVRHVTGHEGADRGVEVLLYSFFNLGAGWGAWLTPRPGRVTSPGKRHGTLCTGGWLGPRAGSDWCGKSRPPSGFDLRTVHFVASHYTY
jgi:hypothetical protein